MVSYLSFPRMSDLASPPSPTVDVPSSTVDYSSTVIGADGDHEVGERRERRDETSEDNSAIPQGGDHDHHPQGNNGHQGEVNSASSDSGILPTKAAPGASMCYQFKERTPNDNI